MTHKELINRLLADACISVVDGNVMTIPVSVCCKDFNIVVLKTGSFQKGEYEILSLSERNSD